MNVKEAFALFHVGNSHYLQITGKNQIHLIGITKGAATSLSFHEDIQLQRQFQLPKFDLIEVTNCESRLTSTASGYNMSEQSFLEFISTKKEVRPVEFFISDHPDFYDGLQSILLYEDDIPIYQTKEGEAWVADNYHCITKRYAYIYQNYDHVFESNDLSEVESAMFKDYFA